MIRTNKLSLYDGIIGDFIKILSLNIHGTMRRRLLDLGFVPGAIVEVVRRSPLGDPVVYRVSGASVALRKEESLNIIGSWSRNDQSNQDCTSRKSKYRQKYFV
ncbi:FeoA family protein [Mesobacillus sp.]|uniref:FeoA family protein n=1 Tax=Mesobacillus sp. TaxID=2675271 RepID=UPI0039EF2028